MIRTVWLAAFCLAGLGGLCASKVTASISRPEDGIGDSAMVSADVVPDTLTAADRIDLTGLRPTAETTLAPPLDPVVIRPIKAKRTLASGLRRQAKTKAKVIAVLPKPWLKFRISRNGKPPKLAGDFKKCPEADSLDAHIMSLTGTSHCG